jgi:hypothetical protein
MSGMNVWNPDTALLLSLIVSGAVWAVVHVALWLRVLHASNLPPALRWLAWLPPLTPVAGFLCGARGWAWLWCIVAVAYLVLRSQA